MGGIEDMGPEADCLWPEPCHAICICLYSVLRRSSIIHPTPANRYLHPRVHLYGERETGAEKKLLYTAIIHPNKIKIAQLSRKDF